MDGRMEILFVLMLNIPANFSVMSGRNHHFLGIACTFRGVNVSLLKDTTQPRPLAPEPETHNDKCYFQYELTYD